MEIRQQKNSNKIRFVFDEDSLGYSIEDSSGSRSFSVGYTDISRDRQTLLERNQWLGNVGLLWLALGAALTGFSLMGDEGLKVSIWLWVGAACYAVYRFRTTRFTIVPTDKGNLYVIDGEEGQRILQEIESRRAVQYRNEYDFMPESETPEQHRARFKWLHREGALSDDDLRQRLATVDALDPARVEQATPELGVRLN
ncbi:hypothetical protein [Marilutibacter alkalisoli]|uniref:Uncharacterized protein n=1 Tax=Marilutibacter alkalisoli TaxID=2591633 RepID=A0A514BSJ1_9GAMM|nr:hypothetical protein [Lysobacter alkalisoli]QDH70356.1 hypothetical protein FKV23_09825 [Lysobacter alkalisoli]